MENLWIFLALSYGILKSGRDFMKKEALKRNSLMETLFFYMFVGFIFTLPDLKSALQCEPFFIFMGFVKAVIVCIGFILSFVAVRGLPLGFYSLMTLSQMVFTTLIGISFLNEPFGIPNLIALLMVITGLVMVNLRNHGDDGKKIKFYAILSVLGYTFCNSVSSAMDKVLTKSITPAQLQFWFMFFSVLFYAAILIVKKEKVSVKTLKTNFWIPLMGFLLVFGDRLLFIANSSPHSRITVITLLLQSSVVISIILGKVIYKEKHFLYKLLCASIIIAGIVIGSL
ncbi:MAG: EamA family transporter [Clostridia bacterium]|nr:EamA family transporter [Clostridia bacterium]